MHTDKETWINCHFFQSRADTMYGTYYLIFVCLCCLFFLVTEDHPQVKAMVLGVMEEAKQHSVSPVALHAEVLQTRIKEVSLRSKI